MSGLRSIGYDNILVEFYTTEPERDKARIEALIGKEVSLTIWFSLRQYEHATKGTQYVQNAYLANIDENGH